MKYFVIDKPLMTTTLSVRDFVAKHLVANCADYKPEALDRLTNKFMKDAETILDTSADSVLNLIYANIQLPKVIALSEDPPTEFFKAEHFVEMISDFAKIKSIKNPFNPNGGAIKTAVGTGVDTKTAAGADTMNATDTMTATDTKTAATNANAGSTNTEKTGEHYFVGWVGSCMKEKVWVSSTAFALMDEAKAAMKKMVDSTPGSDTHISNYEKQVDGSKELILYHFPWITYANYKKMGIMCEGMARHSNLACLCIINDDTAAGAAKRLEEHAICPCKVASAHQYFAAWTNRCAADTLVWQSGPYQSHKLAKAGLSALLGGRDLDEGDAVDDVLFSYIEYLVRPGGATFDVGALFGHKKQVCSYSHQLNKFLIICIPKGNNLLVGRILERLPKPCANATNS